PFNVIDLTDCHTHLSYYTCFSQRATIAGTVIVGGFNPNIIQGGTSGLLRQEFRELEMLDEITRLQSDETLHQSVEGELRTSLMVNY
ncbi:hypothetical protein M422DRAFT_177268, partial [Sphaerobolus stellatus SS14]